MTFQEASGSEIAEHACCGGESHAEAAIPVRDVPAMTGAKKEDRLISALDTAGMTASTICLIHCLAMPVVIALIPAFAAELFESEWFHITLAFAVFIFCLAAFVPGYHRHHDKRLIWIGAAGVSLVFFATFVARFWSETAEIAIVTVGNLVLVAGHLLNRKLTHKVCCPGEDH